MIKRLTLILVIFTIFAIVLSPSIASAKSSHLNITLLNQDPDPVYQGDSVEVRFKIENTGAETLDDVEVEILPDDPFSAYGVTKKNIGKLRSSLTGADAAIVDFKLKVDEYAVAGDNEIELQVNMGSTSYRFVDNQFMIDVEEYDKPDLKAYIRESEILKAGEKGKIVIEVANTNIGNAKFVQIELLPSAKYEILSSSPYVYLGDIDSDDTESEEFEIYVKPDAEGNIVFPLLLKFQDDNEKELEDQFNLDLNIYSQKDLIMFGLRQRNNTSFYIIITILVVVGITYWRRRKKKK